MENSPFVLGKQSHEVVTECLLVSAGFSFHNYQTKPYHAPLASIFLFVRFAAMGVEPAWSLHIELDGRM